MIIFCDILTYLQSFVGVLSVELIGLIRDNALVCVAPFLPGVAGQLEQRFHGITLLLHVTLRVGEGEGGREGWEGRGEGGAG